MTLTPHWPAPKNIRALTLTKDDSLAALPRNLDIRLLNQVHQNHVVILPSKSAELNADGAYTRKPMIACTIKTADCLAIFLCNTRGTEIAALHGGWQGLSQGIIAAGLQQFTSQAKNVLAWLSPAICPAHYEVDHVVHDAFLSQHAELENCFVMNRQGHWHCDLRSIATQQLQQLGVTQIFGGTHCTFEDEENLYSFRRDSEDPGRLLHVIWKE